MINIYRLLAIAMILIGIIVAAKSIQGAFSDSKVNTQPIHCDAKSCRTILPDGTLADDSVKRPKYSR